MYQTKKNELIGVLPAMIFIDKMYPGINKKPIVANLLFIALLTVLPAYSVEMLSIQQSIDSLKSSNPDVCNYAIWDIDRFYRESSYNSSNIINNDSDISENETGYTIDPDDDDVIKEPLPLFDSTSLEILIDKLRDTVVPHVRLGAINILSKTGRPALKHLLFALTKKNDTLQISGVIECIGYIGDKSGINALKPFLASKSETMRISAILALSNLDDTIAIQPLLDLLGNQDENIVKKALFLLYGTKHNSAIKPLLGIVNDTNVLISDELKSEALNVLQSMKDSSAKVALFSVLDNQQAWLRKYTVQLLDSINDTSATMPLVKVLDDPIADVRIAALIALSKIVDQRKVGPIIKCLSDSVNYVRIEALYALRSVKKPDISKEFVNVLNDKTVEVRKHALCCIALRLDSIPGRPDTIALLPILNLIQHGDSACYSDAVRALSRIRDSRAIPALSSLLNTNNFHISQQVIEALGEIKDTNVVSVLAPLLYDKNIEISRTAIHALSKIGGSKAAQLLFNAATNNKLKALQDDKLLALAEIGRPLTGALNSVLMNGRIEERYVAVWVLGCLKDSSSVLPMISALNDTSALIRQYAASALRSLADKRSIKPLCQHLNDSWDGVVWEILTALNKFHDTSTIDTLVAFIKNPELKSSRYFGYAASILVSFNDQRVVAPLIDVIDSIKDYKSEVLLGLGKLKDRRCTTPMLSILKSNDPDIRAIAIEALGDLQDTSAVPALKALLHDTVPNVRCKAAESLQKMGITDILKQMNPFTNNTGGCY
jgi:HEAT repeat protein